MPNVIKTPVNTAQNSASIIALYPIESRVTRTFG